MWRGAGVCVFSVLLCLSIGWAQGQAHGADTSNFTRPVFLCGGRLVTDSGYFASESFPNYYKPSRKCTWYITVPEGHVVMLSFRVFDLEADPRCRYDFVDVYNGHTRTAQMLGRFCGTFRPGSLISTSNTMMVEMESDSETGGRGFLAYFRGGKPHVDEHQFCGGRLTKPQGTVKTPNWPEVDYPAGISCSWHISVEPNMLIEVKFDKFDLEADSYCRYDYVAFFNGGETDDSQRIGKFCGTEVPKTIVTSGNNLLVQFVSDLSVTSDGFMASYSSVPRGSRTPTAGNDIIPGPRVPSVPPRAKPSKPVLLSPKPKPKPNPKSAIKPTAAPGHPKVTPKPRPKPKPFPKPKLKPQIKPGTKPTPKTQTKPILRPGTKPTPKPGTKLIPKPGTKLIQKPSTKPAPKPGIKPVPKPGIKPIPKTGTKPIPKAETKPIPKPDTKPILKPAAKSKSKVDTEMNKLSQNRTKTLVKKPGGNQKPVKTSSPCPQLCKTNTTPEAGFCTSQFVITGKVAAVAARAEGGLSVTVSVIRAYKPGRLAIGQGVQTASVKVTSVCQKCPSLHKGSNYIMMGQVDEEGRGVLVPSSFVLPYKADHQKLLTNLVSRTC
ncbi:procollagen C-endopeptidase enhancer 2-like [Brienomyrus brachyistius]|uniref:procollagen C-endopeptidase enhancer 2-like n=1 Tax=Brienomyrus brachyistius TaxID=42636 RepID=UPI0020B27519|nr:procollagen C-endopeptidase enhancer 2-like [Brienomyrus brachyistius]